MRFSGEPLNPNVYIHDAPKRYVHSVPNIASDVPLTVE